jgi:hypothetical protein
MSDEIVSETEMMSDLELTQMVASDRLVYLRILEGFKNNLTSLLAKLNQDISEINKQVATRNQALVDGGKAVFVEQQSEEEE